MQLFTILVKSWDSSISLIGYVQMMCGITVNGRFFLSSFDHVFLTIKAMNFLIKTLGTKGFFSIRNYHNRLSWRFPIHLNTYVMGLGPLEIFLLLHRGTDFSRQNLTSTDVRF